MIANSVMVSIIIPVYNVEQYLKESLQSVVNQTFSDYEVIIINDGSTDTSGEIIEDFVKKNGAIKIKVINQENQGQAAARNTGIEMAEGKYTYFFDSDDLIEKDALQILFTESEKHNLDLLLFSGDTIIEAKSSTETKYNFNYEKIKLYPQNKKGEEMFIDLVMNDEYTSSPCLFFVKTKVLKDNNLQFHEGIIHEDGLFTYQLILQAGTTRVINNVLFHRRVRASSTMMTSNFEKSFIGNYTVFFGMIEFSKQLGNISPRLKEAMIKRWSIVFTSTINQYIYIESSRKTKYHEEVLELKETSEKYNYFNRLDLWIFNHTPFFYKPLRKLYDYLR